MMQVKEEHIEEADEGELLVLRRALSDKESPNHGEQKEEEVVYADDGDMLELKPLLSIQKCTSNPDFETHTDVSPRKPEKIEFVTPNMTELRPYLNNHQPSNLRANSFLEGENDVSVGDLLDQDKNESSKQESTAKNGLFKAPQVVGKAVAALGLLSVFDPRKGQLC